MPPADLHRAALEFVTDWDTGRQPTLQEYLKRFPGSAPEIIDLVADYVILDAPRPARLFRCGLPEGGLIVSSSIRKNKAPRHMLGRFFCVLSQKARRLNGSVAIPLCRLTGR